MPAAAAGEVLMTRMMYPYMPVIRGDAVFFVAGLLLLLLASVPSCFCNFTYISDGMRSTLFISSKLIVVYHANVLGK